MNASGDVYVSDLFNHRIRRISRAGIITTIAGTGRPGFSGDGGPAVDAQLAAPRGIAIDRVGNLFVADSSNMRIRRIAIDGTINTVAGSGRPGPTGSGGPALQANFFPLWGLTVDDAGVVIFSESPSSGRGGRVWRLRTDGIAEVIAGTGAPGKSGDGGSAPAATFSFPDGVAVDSRGAIYVSDRFNQRVRILTPVE